MGECVFVYNALRREKTIISLLTIFLSQVSLDKSLVDIVWA